MRHCSSEQKARRLATTIRYLRNILVMVTSRSGRQPARTSHLPARASRALRASLDEYAVFVSHGGG
jgi:hypothetical protein